MDKECPTCKQSVPEAQMVCPGCGYPFDSQPAANAYQPPPPTGPAPVAAAKKDKVVAGILGILLGGLGIHGFYIGNIKMGVIILVIGLVGGVVTCGLGYGVAGTIGLIQGILYLVASEEDFQSKYVVGQQWF
ncbi:MAG: NINE protein [Fimbriimonadaceae bacterium]